MRVSVLLLGTFLLPTGASGWWVQSDYEPNSGHDRWEFNHWDPNVSASVEKVYFNGLLLPTYAGMNPNVAAFRGQVLAPGPHHAVAYLGLWTDCNDDGYLGLGETGLHEYRAEALLDDSICPPSTKHNFDGWIHEFLWIGWPDNAAVPQSEVPGLIADGDARVWADHGLPGAVTEVGCPANPPPGAFSSTGALLGWIDCYGARGFLAAFSDVEDLAHAHAPPARELQLRFDDTERPGCSSSLAQVHLDLFYPDPGCPTRAGLLEPGSERPMVAVWDCGEHTAIQDHEGRTLYTVPGVDPSPVDPEGSAYDAASHVLGGVAQTCSPTGGSAADATYRALLPEQFVHSIPIKRHSDLTLEFFNDRWDSYLSRAYYDPTVPPAAGSSHVASLGVPGVVGGSRMGAGWISQSTITPPGPRVKEDMTFVGPAYYTYYAVVGGGVTAFAQMPLGVGFYAAEWCGDHDSGIVSGTDCDRENWWDPDLGAPAMPRATFSQLAIGVAPGIVYSLRDVDCYDAKVTEGVYAGTTYFSNDVCEPYEVGPLV